MAQSSNTLHVRPAAAGTGVDTPAQSVPVVGGGTALAPGYVSLNRNGNVVNPATEDTLEALNIKIPAQTIPGLFPVDTLGTPSRMTPQSVTASSGSVTLLAATRRVSVDVSVGAVVRINGPASVPANGSSLVDAIAIPAGSTKDFDVPAGAVLHFVRDGTTDGTIRITEIV